MKKAIWWFAVLALLAAAGCAQDQTRLPLTIEQSKATSDGALAETHPLFIIERSKNANVVHYDARLTADGKLDPKEPVIAYYVMLAEDGRRKELNWIEKKMAYGFDIEAGPVGRRVQNDHGSRPPVADHREEGGERRPCRVGHRRPAGCCREDVHQFLRRAARAQSPLYRALRKRSADRRETRSKRSCRSSPLCRATKQRRVVSNIAGICPGLSEERRR